VDWAMSEAPDSNPGKSQALAGRLNESVNIETLVVHAGVDRDHLSVPIHQAAVFPFPSVDEARSIHEGEAPGYFYARLGHPTQRALETAVAALEGGEDALAVASGIAAIGLSVLSTVKRGEHVVAPAAIYPTARALFGWFDRDLGIKTSFVLDTSADGYAAAVQSNTRMIYIETPANPALSVTDIAAVSQLGHGLGLTVIVDNTVASPINQRPLALGADIVVHSATKYLAGHGDVVGGVLVAKADVIRRARWDFGKLLGPSIDPFAAWLIIRGIRTLGVRMARHNETALAVARFLAQHPAIKTVRYPGLESHPGHPVALGQMRGFSGLLSFELHSATEARRFLASIRLATLAVSLGDVATLIQHPASMTATGLSPEERTATGVADGLIRLSVGLESQVDLIRDLERALESRTEVGGEK